MLIPHHIHIVGIGGAGMSAIARVLRDRGHAVRGSDRAEGPMVQSLRAEGIPVAVGHRAENVAGAELVLASSAVPEANVELAAAREAGIPVMRRPDFLPALTEGYDLIAIAGAHGKTTVTGMVAFILREAGLDPSFIVGGVPLSLGTNGYAGSGSLFVIEADEYRNTFLALKPKIAVITNIEYDHPDAFPSPRFLRLAFGDFVDGIVEGGTLIACNDDAVAHAVAASFHANGGHLVLYGLEAGKGVAWRAEAIAPNAQGGVDFVALHRGEALGRVRLRLPGRHNALNALAALAVAEAVGVDFEQARAALERFEGTGRRFEVLGEAGGVTVVDDYAHHPTQIRAVLEAAKGRYPRSRRIVVWQPHTFSRIRALWDDFLTAFEGADEVIVLPIYAAREADDGTLDQRMIAEAIEHPRVRAAGSLEEAAEVLAAEAQPGDVVLLLGAGTEYRVGQALLERLAGGEAQP